MNLQAFVLIVDRLIGEFGLIIRFAEFSDGRIGREDFL